MRALVVSGFSYSAFEVRESIVLYTKPYAFLVPDNDEPELIFYNEKDDSLSYTPVGDDYFARLDNQYEFYGVGESLAPNMKKPINLQQLEQKAPLFSDDHASLFRFTLDSGNEYLLENRVTGAKSSYTSSDRFLEKIQENIYMFSKKGNSIYELNSSLEATREFKLPLSKRIFCKAANGLAFILLKIEKVQLIVFDLKTFTILASHSLDMKNALAIYPFNVINERIFLGVGKRYFLWDGKRICPKFENEVIIGSLFTDNLAYFQFESRDELLAYDFDEDKVLKSIRNPIKGYSFYLLRQSGGRNYGILQRAGKSSLGGKAYFSSWTDSEFLASDAWDMDIEDIIYKVTEIDSDPGFKVSIEIDCRNSYEKIARQSLTAVDDVICHHSQKYFPYESYSENFTGELELNFRNAEELTQKQKSELVDASSRLVSRLGFRGAATGKLCSIDSFFAE